MHLKPLKEFRLGAPDWKALVAIAKLNRQGPVHQGQCPQLGQNLCRHIGCGSAQLKNAVKKYFGGAAPRTHNKVNPRHRLGKALS